jgi:hypothetical protein
LGIFGTVVLQKRILESGNQLALGEIADIAENNENRGPGAVIGTLSTLPGRY